MVRQTDRYSPVKVLSASGSSHMLPRPSTDGKTALHTPLTLSLISNCRLLREGLAVMLHERLSLSILGHYLAAAQQTADLPCPKGHVVLLDSNIGSTPALEWIRYWRSREAYVVMIEFGGNTDFLIACIEAGMGGYTLENASIDDIIHAIEQVRRGVATCSPELAGKLFERLACYASNRSRFALKDDVPLTLRELEVLACAAKGYSNQEIADELVISVATVKHHVHNILEKLELPHRWEAIHYAEEQGWIAVSS